MDKQSAVAGLGETALLQPARVRQALKANDRLKVYLGLLQAAAAHARAPDQAPQDLSPEIAAADIQPRDEAAWLREMPASASLRGDMLQLPQWLRLAGHLDDDLHALACPVLGDVDADPEIGQRVEHWSRALRASATDELALEQVSRLCHGQRTRGDSLHLLVMDLHKALNRLAARLAARTSTAPTSGSSDPTRPTGPGWRPSCAACGAHARSSSITRGWRPRRPAMATAC
jgi:hypothetical protein